VALGRLLRRERKPRTVLDQIEALSARNRVERDPEVEHRLVQLRNAAFSEIPRATPRDDWFPPEVDRFEGVVTTPEIPAEDCDATIVRSAVQHHGALLVRGLVSPERCAELRAGIDRSWDAIAPWLDTKACDPAWFDPLPVEGFAANTISRGWGLKNGTAYVADSPRLMFDLLEALRAARVQQLVADYFGEPPVFSLHKTSQRRLPPDAVGAWHQDAAVYGLTTRALNLWLPVSRCGDVAPGLEIWPRPLDHVVDTVGTGIPDYETKPEAIAALTAEVPSERPVFDPGDGLLFDSMLLHNTASSLDFTEKRYGFECWFFAASTFPVADRFVPVVC
jgi:hypothetical protein